jgi:hypothetical protein
VLSPTCEENFRAAFQCVGSELKQLTNILAVNEYGQR